MNIKQRILDFLYTQVQKNNIPQIRKGMVEDVEAFVLTILADVEARQSAQRMEAHSREEDDSTSQGVVKEAATVVKVGSK